MLATASSLKLSHQLAGGLQVTWGAAHCRVAAQPAVAAAVQVFMLPADAVINMELLHRVISAGHSRVPVYSESKQASGVTRCTALCTYSVNKCILIRSTDSCAFAAICIVPVPMP